MIGTAALYLAGKAEEGHVRLRDVINVTYRYFIRQKNNKICTEENVPLYNMIVYSVPVLIA